MGKVISIPSDNLAVAQTLIWNIAQGHCNSEKMFRKLRRLMEAMGVRRLVYGDYAALLENGCLRVGLRGA